MRTTWNEATASRPPMGEAPAAFRIGIMAAGVKGQTALELCQWPGSMLTFLFAGEAYRALGERACAMRPEPKLYLPAFVPDRKSVV